MTLRIGPRRPAPDMADLAQVVRTFIAVDQQQAATVTVGGVCDVVTTASGPLGAALLARLDAGPQGCGPVIAHADSLCWLVPPGTAGRGWSHPAARCTNAGFLTLPPTTHHAPPFPYWARIGADHWVGPGFLRDALDEVDPAGTSCPAP